MGINRVTSVALPERKTCNTRNVLSATENLNVLSAEQRAHTPCGTNLHVGREKKCTENALFTRPFHPSVARSAGSSQMRNGAIVKAWCYDGRLRSVLAFPIRGALTKIIAPHVRARRVPGFVRGFSLHRCNEKVQNYDGPGGASVTSCSAVASVHVHSKMHCALRSDFKLECSWPWPE